MMPFAAYAARVFSLSLGSVVPTPVNAPSTAAVSLFRPAIARMK